MSSTPKSRRKGLLKKYSLDDISYRKMLKSQEGVCMICGLPESRKHLNGITNLSLSVDHCHVTGKVRSLLCSRCNLVLGRVEDCPELLRRMADYLEEKITYPPIYDNLISQIKAFERAVEDLPTLLQDVALDVFVHKLSQKEIAVKRGKSQSWVSCRVCMILTHIHKKLSKKPSPNLPDHNQKGLSGRSLRERQEEMRNRIERLQNKKELRPFI